VTEAAARLAEEVERVYRPGLEVEHLTHELGRLLIIAAL
jgi:hypothetical protein